MVKQSGCLLCRESLNRGAMETLSLSTATTTMSTTFPIKTHKSLKLQAITLNPKFPNSSKSNTYRNISLSSFSSFICCISVSTRIKAASGSSSTLSAPSLGSATIDYHHWMVLMEKPPQGVNSKAEVINYYVKTLERVLGSEKDAQMCIYDASCDTNFGFCCAIDEEASRELTSVPGVLTVQPDTDFESENKDYGGNSLQSSLDSNDCPEENQVAPIKTKKLFVTGLSFYTSEKTLRAAFEPFGELVEVKIIMDKISKRSKGYAFIEYMSEEAASIALKEMNGKIINGWMIVVDVAKSSPPRYIRSRPRPAA